MHMLLETGWIVCYAGTQTYVFVVWVLAVVWGCIRMAHYSYAVRGFIEGVFHRHSYAFRPPIALEPLVVPGI